MNNERFKNKLKTIFRKYIKLLISILGIYILFTFYLLVKKQYIYSLILIGLLMLIILLFYSLYYKVKFINKDFFIKRIKYNRYLKKLNTTSIYSKKMNIITFDGKNEFTHPSVLYFKEKFNEYKFWMVYTPYANCNVSLENPCIAVSNDGIHFQKPNGMKNPLLPIIPIKNKKILKYYNDPNLIYVNNKLELWYRLTNENKIENKLNQKIYRMTSNDGINWEKPELILEDLNNDKNLISISILYKNEEYWLYYIDLNLKPTLIKSKDLINWSSEIKLNIKDYNGNYWHSEIKIIDNEIKYLFIDNTYNLYISKSKNGINFNNTKKINIYCKSSDYLYKKNILYKSSMTEDDKYYYIYVPFRFDIIKLFKTHDTLYKKWITTVTKIKKDDLAKIEEELK